MRKSHKSITGLLLSALLALTLTTPAQAAVDEQIIYDPPFDNYLPEYLDVTAFEYSETDERKGVHYFAIETYSIIPSNVLTDGNGSWFAVYIDSNRDGRGDYRLQLDEDLYLSSRSVPVKVLRESSLEPIPGCTAGAYTGPGSNWIYFFIDYSCLKLPKTFNASALAALYDNPDEGYYDFAPDDWTEFQHSWTSRSVSKKTVTRPTATNEVAFKNSQTEYPSEKVGDETLSAVVSIICGESLGSGFAVSANIPASVAKSGLKSYIVTEYDLIKPCERAKTVKVSTSEYENYTGYISIVDKTNGLAGLYIEKQLPTLSIRGEAPAKDWWVGAISLYYDDGEFYGGNVIKAPPRTRTVTETTIPNIPYSFGGPVVDSQGRVVGIMTWPSTEDGYYYTANYTNASELCDRVINCGKNKAWLTGLKAEPKVKTYANCAALNKVYPGGVAQSNSRVNKGKAVKNKAYISSSVYSKNKKFDTDKDGIACEK